MKKYLTFIVGLILLSLSACKKGEKLEETTNVVRFTVNGSSAKELEIIYKGEIVAKLPTKFGQPINLAVGSDSELQIRETGSTSIIATRNLTPTPFEQAFSLYYDGTKVYEKSVSYQLKGYAMSGELEFLIDGQLVEEGTLKIDKTLTIYMNGSETRQLTVRKKSETTALITKAISASTATGQSLKFFFDGAAIVDNVQLTPPTNPANMSITAQFSTSFVPKPGGGALVANFKGGSVDLVFYIRNTAGLITVPNPEIRITMQSSGPFVTFELPPLPNAQSFYTYDICEVGTNELPYTNFGLAATYPPKLNKGLYGELRFDGAYFKAGASKMLMMQETSRVVTSPATARARYVYGAITDLSQYFQ